MHCPVHVAAFGRRHLFDAPRTAASARYQGDGIAPACELHSQHSPVFRIHFGQVEVRQVPSASTDAYVEPLLTFAAGSELKALGAYLAHIIGRRTAHFAAYYAADRPLGRAAAAV